ncbi:ankyrin [Eremomyces bilateralis CBS 781.70]|uniref:Ankyrin n=1 Tax=Eremomyces bilateralis CBS 781.70 TaxID=1392243 RepID=A0A6G1FR04_9PEZI|nr:ankyrin [Eremomyces bilateralis CBS 781.70]KAF1808265.1 ankyrin [Eremomyces bilateralis CBS 781.70]
MNNDIKDINTQVHAVRHSQQHQRHQTIAGWISPSDFPAQQSDFIGRIEEGTGQWFLDSSEYATWLRTPKSTLFCPGIPGAGKTMLAAITIDRLSRTEASDDIGLAYIYCNYKSEASVDVSALLAALLQQLVQSRPTIDEPISSLYEKHTRRGTRPSLQEISTALQVTLKNFSSVYIVVDALDECPNKDGTRNHLLTKLKDTQQEADLRLMVTSRFIPDIEAKLESTPILEIRARGADVKRFVRGQICRLPNCIQRDHQLQSIVEDKVIEAVDGMFLLARLHVDSLLDKRTRAKVQATLKTLPRGPEALGEAYKDGVQRIGTQLPEDTANGNRELDRDNIPDIDDVISVCAGLVIVDKESNIVRLVHYTTQEYFEQIREIWNPTAQQEIASACLTYLSFHVFRDGSCSSDDDLDSRLKEYPLLDYAARYWGYHIRSVQEGVSEVAYRFLQNNGFLSSATQAVSIPKYRYPGFSQRFPKHTTGLHLSARFGLVQLLMIALLHSEYNIAARPDLSDSYGRTPLSYAAKGGHETVVRLLVERDDVATGSKDKDGRTPLSWAAERGYEAIVQLLVEQNDVAADSKDKDGRTPLSWAAEQGYEGIVRLLVDRDDVAADLKDRLGHEAIVQLMVERDDVATGSKDKDGRTPLSWAEERGYKAIVQLLVEQDNFATDLKDGFGRTPISSAVSQRHQARVRLHRNTEKINQTPPRKRIALAVSFFEFSPSVCCPSMRTATSLSTQKDTTEFD